jgi:predicted PurR-regulated permease PerM
VVLLTDSILDRVGGFVLGNLFTSLVAGIGTSAWAAIVGVPYPVFLGLLVALLDLIPVALPALATVTTTVIGGALLGVIGALVAIPIAAAVQLLIQEVAEPSLERS